MIGIYAIINNINGNCYIGSSNQIEKRIITHRHLLKHNKHYNDILQRAWNKYSKDKLQFTVIMKCHRSELLALEQLFFEIFKPEYNIAKDAIASMRGRKHSLQTRQKMSSTAVRLNSISRANPGWNRRAVRDNLDNIFISLKEAASFHGIHVATVCDILNLRHAQTRKGVCFEYI